MVGLYDAVTQSTVAVFADVALHIVAQTLRVPQQRCEDGATGAVQLLAAQRQQLRATLAQLLLTPAHTHHSHSTAAVELQLLHPVIINEQSSPAETAREAVEGAARVGAVRPGDTVVVVSGSRSGSAATDTLRVLRVT